MRQCRITKVFVVPLCVVFLLIQTASIYGLFQLSFQTIEKYVVKKNIQFCTNALSAELKRIDSITYEWAAWDDTAMFIQGKAPDFIRQNLFIGALLKKNLDVLCILDLNGKPIWSRAKARDRESRDIELSMFTPQVLQKETILWNHKDPNSYISGYYPTEGGVLMFSSRPVTSNNNTGPIYGTIIMGRFVSDKVIASIARQDSLDFKWWNLHSEYTKQAVKEYVSRITGEDPVFIELGSDTLTAYTILPGLRKENAILLKFVLANELVPYKNRFMAISTVIYFVEGFLFLIGLIITANKQCEVYSRRTKQAARISVVTTPPASEETTVSQDVAPQDVVLQDAAP
jgi:sensor domain CHASE-containing protein